MFAAKDSLLTRPNAAAYEISRSLRFNSADNAYLSRTPASATNRKTFTWSGWVKRSALPAAGVPIFSTEGTPYSQYLCFGGTDMTALTTNALCFFSPVSGSAFSVQSAGVYRDVSAWYHIVCAVDTTQTTAANRVRLYVNGSEVSYGTSTYPAQNLDTYINSTGLTNIGSTAAAYFSGYITEVNFIDGQALTPSSFGLTNAITGVWQPKAYAGTYGTNGFYLNFSDNSALTTSSNVGIGKDYSGNGNYFATNNISITAGVTNDSFVDTPTPYGVDTGAGGEVRGNYCTINPLDGVGTATITEGNLKFVNTGANAVFRGTMGMTGSSGKWYFEFTQQTVVGTGGQSPIVYGMASLQGTPSHTPAVIQRAAYYYTDYLGRYLNVIFNGASSYISVATAIAINDVLQFAYDSDTGKVWVGKGGVWSDSTGGTTGNPATGANPVYTFSSVDQPMTPTFEHAGVDYTATLNCGQRAFVNTAPSGFKALCTQNLPAPTISKSSQFFAPVLWTGNGASTRAITGVGFQPDFTWIKKRDEALSHLLYDAVRTAGINKALSSNDTNSEANVNADATYGYLSSFDSDGISVARGTNGTVSYTNANSGTYVAWNWRASNATAVSNTAGSLTSQVSANTTAGFSVLTYTGNPASGQTIGHGLGVAPSMIIVKGRTGGNWAVYHKSLGIDQYVFLNDTAAANTVTGYWGTTAPSATTFGVIGGGYANNSGTAVAYCFAPIAGFSAFGSYTGNGSTDGPFVYCGFRPSFILGKDSGGTNNWFIFDSARDTYNVAGKILRPNLSDAELDSPPRVDLLSNGFKLRSAALPNDATTYIFMAFAENPFKYSLAR